MPHNWVDPQINPSYLILVHASEVVRFRSADILEIPYERKPQQSAIIMHV